METPMDLYRPDYLVRRNKRRIDGANVEFPSSDILLILTQSQHKYVLMVNIACGPIGRRYGLVRKIQRRAAPLK